MSGLDVERVARACERWVWIPDTATTAESDEHLLVRYPDWFFHPLELARLTPADDGDEALERALDGALLAARAFDVPEVTAWVRLGAPASLDAMLEARGGVLDETLDVLALDLGGPLPDLDVPDDVAVEVVDSVDGLRTYDLVSVEVFGGDPAPEDHHVHELASVVDELERGAGCRMVARLDGEAVGTGGLALVEGDARLWGGAVREAARGRGAYRALLDARLRWSREHGAEVALVKGRVETSGPVLRRAGFEVFGQERSFTVPLR